MRLPRKYKKECKKRFLSSPIPDKSRQAFRDLYKYWVIDLSFYVDNFTWDLRRYVDDGCNSRRNCRSNLNPRIFPSYRCNFNLEEFSIASKIISKTSNLLLV